MSSPFLFFAGTSLIGIGIGSILGSGCIGTILLLVPGIFICIYCYLEGHTK